jgi:hypothetical protein
VRVARGEPGQRRRYAHLMPDAFEYARKAAQTELAEFKISFSDGTATEQWAA